MVDEKVREYHREYQRERVERLKGQPLPEGVEHGTPNAYTNYSCRCELCKTAYREYQLPRTEERRKKSLEPDDSRHGTYNGYVNYGCRCGECVEANRVYSLGYKLRNGLITQTKYTELMEK